MRVFGLIDCNNFYASCERLFQPRLNGKPIIVLSNNDGCVIARSNEAKPYIDMGAAFHQIKPIIAQNNINVFSSNYALYGDISRRVMNVISECHPDIEVYSIDEAFIVISANNDRDLNKVGTYVRERVYQCVGIPVCVGFAPSKTLAKLANHIAKKHTEDGVYSLCHQSVIDEVLPQFPVSEIWGIGRKLTQHLRTHNFISAKDLANANPVWVRKSFSVLVEKTVKELNGISCIDLEAIQPKKSILSSKSFGQPVSDLSTLHEAISEYSSQAAIKLRKQNSIAGAMQVFIKTSPFHKTQAYYSNQLSTGLPYPTLDKGLFLNIAKLLLDKIYREGLSYQKAGIMLLDLHPIKQRQPDLFANRDSDDIHVLMKTLDEINSLYGKKTLYYAAQGQGNKAWAMRQQFRSPRYTTHWDEIVKTDF